MEDGGTRRGFEIDAARAWARARGYDVQFEPFRWPDLETDLRAGRFDVVMSGVTVRAERIARSPMSAAVTRAEAGLYVRAPLPGLSRPAPDGRGLRVAVNRGGHLERLARARLPAADLQLVTENRSLPDLLRHGEVDAIVADGAEAASFPPGIVRARRLGSGRKAWWAAPDRPELAADLSRWANSPKGRQQIASLRQRWGLPPPAPVGSALSAAQDRVVDLVARRLALMPLVAEAKRAAGDAPSAVSPPAAAVAVLAPTREAEIRERARARARANRLEVDGVLDLVEAQLTAARGIQERVLATETAATSVFSLDRELRPAIDAIDDELARALGEAVPRTSAASVWRAALAQETVGIAVAQPELDRLAAALAGVRPAAVCRTSRRPQVSKSLSSGRRRGVPALASHRIRPLPRAETGPRATPDRR